MNKFNILLKILIISTILSSNVLAYINPGTGAAIIGSVWPLIVAVFSAMFLFLVKYFWKPIKNFFKNDKNKEKVEFKEK